MKKNKVAANLNESIDRIINKNTNFDTVETYKSIRTNIMFSLPKTDSGKIISLASANPDEGKTTTSINLAITFAQTGAKVILLDCDLRKARIHRYLQINRWDGVSNILCGFVEFEKAVKRNVRENLDVLTAGEIPPNPAELLNSIEFSKLFEKLRKEYDYIIVDTPPVNVVTDAAIVAKQADGVIFVVRENSTTFDSLDDAISSIKNSDANILGVIAVGCENKRKKYSYKNSKLQYSDEPRFEGGIIGH